MVPSVWETIVDVECPFRRHQSSETVVVVGGPNMVGATQYERRERCDGVEIYRWLLMCYDTLLRGGQSVPTVA